MHGSDRKPKRMPITEAAVPNTERKQIKHDIILHFEVARCTLREKEQAEPLSQLDVT
jgi:hypothetical protein